MTDHPSANCVQATAPSTPGHAHSSEVLRVVGGGEPTDEELAALVVALATRAAPAAEPATPVAGAWTDRRRGLRQPLPHGPGAWRWSGR